MRIRFRVSKIANQFFFVNNLAEWHFSCSPEINKAWLRATEPLTFREKDALEAMREKILRKYYFALWDIFYGTPNREIGKALKHRVGAKDYEIVRTTFGVFEKRFLSIWKRYGQKGKKRVDALARFARKPNAKDFFDEIHSVFGGVDAKESSVFRCTVVFSPLAAGMGGSANMKSNTVLLELPDATPSRQVHARALAVIGHEMGHFFFKKRGGGKFIERAIKAAKLPRKPGFSRLSTYELINEAMTGSFVPRGYLAQKYFPGELGERVAKTLAAGVRIKKTSFYNGLDAYFIRQLWPYAIQYIRDRRPVDRDYIMRTAALVKGLLQ